MSENVLPIFSFMSFIVSYFVFKSLCHLEFMFVCGVRVFQPFVYSCDCLTFPAPLSKETIFSSLCILASFVEFQLTIGAWICFCCPYSVPLIYMYIFCQYHAIFITKSLYTSDYIVRVSLLLKLLASECIHVFNKIFDLYK